MNKNRTALIVGATGLIGGHCVRQALASDIYSEVIVVGRRKLNLAHSRLKQVVGELSNLDALLKGVRAEDVYCCLGTTIKKAKTKSAFKTVDFEYPLNLATLMRQNGSEHFCVVSSAGANARSHFFYNRVKGQLEQALQPLGYPFLTIMRPSLLTGDRDEYRLAESISATVGSLIKPLMKGVLLEVSPVEAEKVALAMVVESKNIVDGLRYKNKVVITSRQIQELNN